MQSARYAVCSTLSINIAEFRPMFGNVALRVAYKICYGTFQMIVPAFLDWNINKALGTKPFDVPACRTISLPPLRLLSVHLVFSLSLVINPLIRPCFMKPYCLCKILLLNAAQITTLPSNGVFPSCRLVRKNELVKNCPVRRFSSAKQSCICRCWLPLTAANISRHTRFNVAVPIFKIRAELSTIF